MFLEVSLLSTLDWYCLEFLFHINIYYSNGVDNNLFNMTDVTLRPLLSLLDSCVVSREFIYVIWHVLDWVVCSSVTESNPKPRAIVTLLMARGGEKLTALRLLVA